jgi:hypothetical protein
MTGVQARTDVQIRELLLSGDPKTIDSATFAQASAATRGSVTDTTTYAVADQDTKNFQVTIDGGTAQTVTFAGATTTAAQVIDQINAQITGGRAVASTTQVKIESDTTGVGSSVAITAGTSDLAWAAAVAGTGGVECAENTVVVQDPATEKWYPMTNAAATDGTEIPLGILVGGSITAAALGAADVTGQTVMVGGPVTVDRAKVVLQNSLTLSTEVTNQNMTIESMLRTIGIFIESVSYIPQQENV